MQSTIRPSACLFDMDGLLLNTEDIYTAVTQRIIGRYGHTYGWDVKARMIGLPEKDSARILIDAYNLPLSPDSYLQARNAALLEAMGDCQPLPGAQALVRALHGQGMPIALVTSSSRELRLIKTRLHRSWFDLFDCIIDRDDAHIQRGKPAPDVFLAAAERLNAPPEQAMVFEDSPSGLAAGIAAGMRVVAVPHAEMTRDAFTGAHLVLDSLEAFPWAAYGLGPPLAELIIDN